MQNENWTWTDKYMMDSMLLRPFWIDMNANDSGQEASLKFIPVQAKNLSTKLWLNKQKIIDRTAEVGIEEKELEDMDAEEVIIEEMEEVWTTEEVLIENWLENGWTNELLPEGDEPKVVKWSKREMTLKDHMAPEVTQASTEGLDGLDETIISWPTLLK